MIFFFLLEVLQAARPTFESVYNLSDKNITHDVLRRRLEQLFNTIYTEIRSYTHRLIENTAEEIIIPGARIRNWVYTKLSERVFWWFLYCFLIVQHILYFDIIIIKGRKLPKNFKACVLFTLFVSSLLFCFGNFSKVKVLCFNLTLMILFMFMIFLQNSYISDIEEE